MKTFLEYVARDIIDKYGTDLSRIAVVFPNKRASLFLNEHFARIADGPLWSPAYITISDLFRRHTDLKVGDPIKLICDLYKSYAEVTGTDETLDHFYGWGQIMLADFDDIDKNMADAEKVFKNVSDIHELDDVSYINEEQIAAIQKFFSNFSEEKNTELKRRFLKMWSRFYDIYTKFNERLDAQGLAYEGALYRKVACDETVSFEYNKYIFIGFNVLQRVEQRLFDRLMKDGKAKFYWDFDKYYMPSNKTQGNGDGIGENYRRSFSEAGHYIASYLEYYPNELDVTSDEIYSNFNGNKNIKYISAPTENIQARYISQWLREGDRIDDGRKTAIVLCNEGLLQTAIHCIPDEVDKVNVTTGYPLSQSPFASLISSLIDLRTDGYSINSDRFRLKYINALLRHPYICYVTNVYSELLNKINVKTKIYYPSEKDLKIDEGTTVLFHSLEGDAAKPYTQKLMEWLLECLRLIAANANNVSGNTQAASDPLFQESLFQTYTLVNRLCGLIAAGDLTVDIVTLRRLMRQILQATSIPFHGEPAIGIQFMGVLETRNIDFDHVLMLSCSEGNMPKGVNDTSFIPYNIRKAHGLTTIDNKVAIYAYYFHRLLQRATDITLVYNNSTDGTSTGEMSRFMLQMLVESGHSIERKTLRTSQSSYSLVRKSIQKTDKVMELLHKRFDLKYNSKNENPLLTPTAINCYNRCQLQFYYNYVVGIREDDENEEDEIDFATFGVIFHDSAQKIYERLKESFGSTIEKEHLRKLLNSDAYIQGVISEVFNEQLFKIPQNSKITPDYNGLQLINFKVIMTYIKLLIKADTSLAPFRIVSLEEALKRNITIETDNGSFTSTIGGRVDRMDRVNISEKDMCIRIIDYKTGRFHGQGTPTCVEDIFDREKKVSNAGYYLQTFVYSDIVRSSRKLNPLNISVSPALLYIQHVSGQDYDPTLCFGDEKITDIAPYSADFNKLLSERLTEIFSKKFDFVAADDDNICSNCPYLQICGTYHESKD